MYLESFSLSLPIVMLIKDHLVNQEKGEVEYFLLSSLHLQVNWQLLLHYIRDCLCKRMAFE